MEVADRWCTQEDRLEGPWRGPRGMDFNAPEGLFKAPAGEGEVDVNAPGPFGPQAGPKRSRPDLGQPQIAAS